MKGDIIRFEQQQRVDELTGVKVTRLTDDQADIDHPYFTAAQVDPGGDYILGVSSRSGSSQLYLVGLKEGKLVQVTHGEKVHSACLDAVNQRAFYFDGRMLKSVRLDTLEECELMSVPEGFEPDSLSATEDGHYLAFTMIEAGHMELATAQYEALLSGGSKGFREKFFRYPSSVILRYDTQVNTGYVVTGELRRMTHVIIHPRDGNTILFCHEGPWKLVQRMWIAKVSTDEVFPLVKTTQLLESVGHEFFTASGRVGAQYSYRYRPDVNFFLHADIYVNPDGSDERRYYYPYNRPVHVHAHPSGDLAVGDTAQIRAEDADYRNYICLIRYNAASHQAIVGRLCRHDTSWVKTSHPHPVYTPDGEHVIWGSDAGGKMNLYMARADLERCIWSDR